MLFKAKLYSQAEFFSSVFSFGTGEICPGKNCQLFFPQAPAKTATV